MVQNIKIFRQLIIVFLVPILYIGIHELSNSNHHAFRCWCSGTKSSRPLTNTGLAINQLTIFVKDSFCYWWFWTCWTCNLMKLLGKSHEILLQDLTQSPNCNHHDHDDKATIDRSRYYYSHLVAARGCGSRYPPVRVVWTNMTKECEV